MAEHSAIEWTDATWNPWTGCAKVSPGCKNCYMFREKRRYGQDPAFIARSKTTFRDPLKWAKQIRAGKRAAGLKVFVCSWSDFFIREADAWRAEAWAIIRDTPEITYQLVTKRIERAAACLPPDWGAGYPNVWLGTSVENQEYADRRIPLLLQVPARVHWISAEPLLRPIELTKVRMGNHYPRGQREDWRESVLEPHCFAMDEGDLELAKLDWVVAGGESGPACRPPRPEWIRGLRDQCQDAGVPFFFKQWGEAVPEFAPVARVLPASKEYPAGRVILAGDFLGWKRVGKKNAGAVLDGHEWKEFPDLGEGTDVARAAERGGTDAVAGALSTFGEATAVPLNAFTALDAHARGCEQCRTTPEDPCAAGRPLFEAAKRCGVAAEQ